MLPDNSLFKGAVLAAPRQFRDGRVAISDGFALFAPLELTADHLNFSGQVEVHLEHIRINRGSDLFALFVCWHALGVSLVLEVCKLAFFHFFI